MFRSLHCWCLVPKWNLNYAKEGTIQIASIGPGYGVPAREISHMGDSAEEQSVPHWCMTPCREMSNPSMAVMLSTTISNQPINPECLMYFGVVLKIIL